MRNITFLWPHVHCMAKSVLLILLIMVVVTSSLANNAVSQEGFSRREVAPNNKDTKDSQTTNKISNKSLASSSTNTVGSQSERENGANNVRPTAKDETALKGSNKGNGSLSKCKNGTCESDKGFMNSIFKRMSNNSAMLFRTMFVLLGVTGIVIVYFVFRAVRLRRRRSKSRKYGVITRGGTGDMEMEPLGDGNDDDEDYTVFEMNGRRK